MLNLFEITLKLNGFPLKKAKDHLRNIQEITANKYEDYILEQRQAIVAYHLKNNPFYQSLNPNKPQGKWEDIPVMKKKDLQIPLKKRISNSIAIKNCHVGKTSGSSGQPLIFAKDKYCHALTWAHIINRFGWYNIDFNKSLQARFYGIPLDTIGYQKERLKDWLSHRYRFPIFDLSEEKLASFLKTFGKKKFYFINGHTSSIVLFAKYIKAQNLVLNEVCPSLKYCIVTSEMLYPSDKILLQEALGVPIINEYGASEVDLIAFTNKQDQFLVNSETVFVEILDQQDRVLPYGTPGRIVVTSLYNKAQPIIRYDIGDRGSLAVNSTFKEPILEEILGRSNDNAILPSGKVIPGHTLYYVTKSVIEDDGNIKEFVVEQHSVSTFKIIYVSENILDSIKIKAIQQAMDTYLEPNLILEFENVETLDRSRRGKLKQFSSKIQ